MKNANIKVGDIIYRIYESGVKKLGIACTIESNKGCFPYSWNDTETKWNGFFSLEYYGKEGGQSLFDGYGIGKFVYQKRKSQTIPKTIAKKLSKCEHLNRVSQPIK